MRIQNEHFVFGPAFLRQSSYPSQQGEVEPSSTGWTQEARGAERSDHYGYSRMFFCCIRDRRLNCTGRVGIGAHDQDSQVCLPQRHAAGDKGRKELKAFRHSVLRNPHKWKNPASGDLNDFNICHRRCQRSMKAYAFFIGMKLLLWYTPVKEESMPRRRISESDEVLASYLFAEEGRTQAEIGAELGVSAAVVSRVLTRVLRKSTSKDGFASFKRTCRQENVP